MECWLQCGVRAAAHPVGGGGGGRGGLAPATQPQRELHQPSLLCQGIYHIIVSEVREGGCRF